MSERVALLLAFLPIIVGCFLAIAVEGVRIHRELER